MLLLAQEFFVVIFIYFCLLYFVNGACFSAATMLAIAINNSFQSLKDVMRSISTLDFL